MSGRRASLGLVVAAALCAALAVALGAGYLVAVLDARP